MTHVRPLRLLHETLLRSAEAAPDKTAIVAGSTRLTYADFLDRALRFAAVAQELGLRRGDRVVLYMDNSADCAVTFFGTLLGGCCVVVVNPQTKEDKLAYVLSDCEARLLVTEGAISGMGLGAASRSPSVVETLVAGRPDGIEGGRDLEPAPAADDRPGHGEHRSVGGGDRLGIGLVAHRRIGSQP